MRLWFVVALVWLAGAALAQEGADLSRLEAAMAEAAAEGAPGGGAPGEPDIAGNIRFIESFFEGATPSQKEAFRARYTSVLAEAYAETLEAQFAYRVRGYEHRARVFDWQLTSSRVIFWVVIGVVAAGLVFSWLQFRLGLEQSRASGKPMGMSADMEGSTTGVKISSNVVGLVILALSLGFFYLYLVYVYPVSEVF